MNFLEGARRVVVKVGTSVLTHRTGATNFRNMERLVQVLADIKNSGKDVVLVSSGAIGVGAGKLGLPSRPKDDPGKQACASIGQCELMYTYDRLFTKFNHTVAQILLTNDIIADQKGKTNVINTFEKLLSYGAIPIVNENDAVSTDELKLEFEENDALSVIVAEIIQADALILLSDIDGLYDKDPNKFEDAKPIPLVTEISDDIRNLAGGSAGGQGTGGMVTKINAAQRAMALDIPMMLIDGRNPLHLYDLLDGKQTGTLFWKGGDQ